MDVDTDSISTFSSIGPSVSSVGVIGSVGNKRKRKNASDVYDFISELDSGDYQCLLCTLDAQVWRSRHTGNFRKHLIDHHADIYINRNADHLASRGAIHVANTVMTAEAVRDCDEKLVKWIVVNAQAFAVVDQKEFVEFCRDLLPEYSVPCQQTIQKRVLDQWKTEKEAARFEIRREVAGRRASFTTDMWTSPSKRGYMVITMHFIDSSWEMRSLIIAFTRVMYPHTGKRLADHFIRAVKDMDVALLRSIWTITADNATNNTSMVAEMNDRLQGDIERLMRTNLVELAEPGSPPRTQQNTSSARTVVQLRCTAHVLQLAVKEGLELCPFVDSAIGHFRDLVKTLTDSSKLSEALQVVCADLDENFITPKLDVPTRWNSTWIMLESLITLKWPLNELLRRIRGKVRGYTDFTISPSDSLAKEIQAEAWTAVEALYKFLQPIKEATDMLSASTYPTFGILLYAYSLIKFHATETIAKVQDHQTLKFAKAVKAKMDKYTRKVNTPEARIAIALDPRTKRHLHLLVTDVEQIKQEIENEFNQNYREEFLAQHQPASGPPSAKKKRGNELKVLMARFSNQNGEAVPEDNLAGVEGDGNSETNEAQDISREDSSFGKELDRWLTADEGMSEMRESKYVCAWFQAMGDVYPRIKRMAQDFLAVTATSVPSEIAFSAAGIALNTRRARVGDDTIKAICELKSFYSFNRHLSEKDSSNMNE